MAYPDPPAEDFGTRLKRLAKARGLTNKELAQRTGAHEVTVSRWMGGSEPKGVTLLRLAELLGVSSYYLLTGLQAETNPPDIPIMTHTPVTSDGKKKKRRAL